MTMRLLYAILLCLPGFYAFGQSFSTGPSKEMETFFYRVKNIDDFIERFNDDPRSSIRLEFKKMNREALVSRPRLLMSVFNWQNEQLKSSPNTQDFFNQVADSASPRFIQFTDSNWFATAKCQFSLDGVEVELPLVLHVRHMGEKGTKWMIAGIGNNPVFDTAQASAAPAGGTLTRQSIPPSNYAVNFLELRKILNSNMDETSCFEADVLQTDKGHKMVQLIRAQRLKFVQSKEIIFHFLQLSDWVFSVEEFTRNTKNSGWLINNVRRVTPEEKEKMKLTLLYRN